MKENEKRENGNSKGKLNKKRKWGERRKKRKMNE